MAYKNNAQLELEGFKNQGVQESTLLYDFNNAIHKIYEQIMASAFDSPL